MKSLVVGAGQVGQALFSVIKDTHESYLCDILPFQIKKIEVLHVCYPDSDNFIEITENYINKYRPLLTVIHSSVSVGTTDKIKGHVVYSPIRGRHPKLVKDLFIYTKFIFGETNDLKVAFKYFSDCGLKVIANNDSSGGELLKLLSNIHMGLEISWRQEVERILEHYDVSPDLYGEWEETYRDGYELSGDKKIMRPMMRPDPIGGHCILTCLEILKKTYDSPLFRFIEESNKKSLKGELVHV